MSKLTKIDCLGESKRILVNRNIKFKILLDTSLDNNYSFKQLKSNNGNKKFDNFIRDTIGKGLTISEVDKLYRRTKGVKETIEIQNEKYELVHYGKDRKQFRIFGYYKGSYFVLKKLDTNHTVHKE